MHNILRVEINCFWPNCKKHFFEKNRHSKISQLWVKLNLSY